MKLELFKFNGANVRAIARDSEPWFMAGDACRILDLGNVAQAVSGLDDDEKDTITINDGTPGNPTKLIINESGLYSLVIRSRKPEAKAFKKWITSEVLPAIRKTGKYAVSNSPALPQSYSEALRALAEEVEAKERLALENAEMKPKADFYDAVVESEDTVDMAAAAKLIKVGMGRNTLMAELRNRGILRHNNMPYQQYIDRGYFAVVESKWQKPDGSQHITLKTVVYQKGVEFLRRLFTSQNSSEAQPNI